MTTYPEHNDSEGRAIRLLAQASNADRRRMLAVLQERDMGCVTLCMSRHEVAVARQIGAAIRNGERRFKRRQS